MGRLTTHGSFRARHRIPALRPLCAVVVATTVCALLPTLPAGAATVTPPTNPMQVISPPPSAELGKLTSATLIREWDEKQRVTLSTPLAVDLVAGGTYTKTTQVPASASIPAGTVVDSHMIHADAPGKQTEIRGIITYAQPIVGVIIKSAKLDTTDAAFGPTGTIYSKSKSLRGLELSPDVLIFSGNTLELRSTTYDAWDEVRVFTRSAPLLTATTLSEDRATVGAGVSTVPVSDIPSSALTASSDPNSTAAASFSSAQLSSTALKRVDIASSTLGSIALKRVALKRVAAGEAALDTILLSEIPVSGGWGPLLAGTPFEFVPLQTITLGDVIDLPQVAALTLSQLDLSSTILGEIPAVALALGSLQLADIPLTDAVATGTPTQRLQAWCDALGAATCAAYGIDPANPASADGVTVTSLSVAGTDLASIALKRVALKRVDLDQTALKRVALKRVALKRVDGSTTPLGGLTLGAIPAAGRPTIVDCTAIDCNNLTLTLATIPPAAIIGTVGDLFALAGQSAALDAVLAQLTVEDVFPGVVDPSDLSWEGIDLRATALQNVANPLEPVVTYSVQFTTGGVANLTVDFTMADGFVYTPGTAKLDGVLVTPPAQLPGGILRFTLTNVPTGPHTLTLGNRASTELGPTSASVKVSATAGTQTVDATTPALPVSVVESFELNGAAGDFKTFANDTLYVSHISSATDLDYYKFDITPDQANAGASAEIFLGNLAADYDLTLYGPPPATASRPPDETQTSVEDNGLAASPSRDAVAPDLVQDIPVNAGLGAVVAVAANRGTHSEKIETGTLVAGTYTLQVSGYNGAFSPEPYVVRQHLTNGIVPPACTARPLPFPAGPAGTLADPSSYPNDLNTIFLVAPQRFAATFGSPRTDPVLADINAVSDMGPEVVGATVPVDADPQVASAYAAWAANRCSPLLAQKVADAISALVDRIRAARPSLKNVVVIGDDSVIPMARVQDGTTISNERDFAEDVNAHTTNNELVGSVAAGYVLSDDIYGAPRRIDILNSTRQLYLPRLAVGRLVESPEDISAALTRFHDSHGRLDPLTAAGSSSIVTGYDFLRDGADAVASELAGKTTPRPSLISESWTRDNLKSALFGSTAPDVASLNAHFDTSRLLPAAGNATGTEDDLFTIDDVDAAGPNALLGRLLFSMGCHSGLNVSDVAVGTPTPDWAQTLTGEGQGALWAGNTGYGYGDTELVAYSEKLMAEFAGSLANGRTIGGALAAAKNSYKAETQPLSPYDEKVLQEVVLYGLPMYKPGDAPANADPVDHPATGSGPALTTEPVTGLDVASVPVSLTLPPTTGPNALHPNDTDNGRYYDVDGNTVQVQYRPVEPLVNRDVTQPNGSGGLAKVAHGALITGLTSVDELGFSPYFSRPLIDLGAHEALTEPVGDAVFPASMLRVNSTVDPDGNEVQSLAVVPGQFRPDPATPGSGTQRLFTSVQTLVHYAPPGNTDFTAPTILRSTGSVVNGTVGISVETDATAKRVFVLYKGSGTTGPTAWTGIDLVRTPGTNRWTGGGLTTSPEVEFFVQAGDDGGNWGTSNNKASDFLATKPAPAGGPISISVAGTQVNGWFTGPTTATITDTASTLVSYSLDGAAFVPYTGPIVVTGDGVHNLLVSDNLGNTKAAVAPIDTVGPTVSAVAEPGPTADGFNAGAVDVTITAVDGGGSGVTQINYSASGAQPIAPTSSPGSSKVVTITADGTTTLSFSATDSVGKTGPTGSISVKIDANGPVVLCGTASEEWSATDVSVPCTASDAGSGLANSADAEFSLTTSVPTGTETANASTDSRTVADKVGHTSIAGPITGIKIDKLAPALTVSSPVSGDTVEQGESGAAAVFECADAGSGMVGGSASCTVSINGGPSLTSPVPIETALGGPTTLLFTAVDAVGNTSTATVTITVVDSTPPFVTCDSPSTEWSATDVSVPCHATDTGGSGLVNPADAEFSLTTNVPAGTETANAATDTRTIFDNGGNSSTAGPISGIKVDKKAPSITTSPASGATFAQGLAGVAAVFSCADVGSGMVGGSASCTVSIDGGPSLTSPASISTVTLGPVSLVFTGVDAVGNTSTATVTITIVDKTKPVVVCGTPGTAWSATDVPISCTATDTGSGLANPADALFSLTTNVPAGTETTNASTGSRTVLDIAGNSTTVGPITGIKVDKKAPTLTVTSPTNGATINQGQAGVLALFTCADAGSGMVGGLASCTVKINGGAAVASGAIVPTGVVGPVTLVFTAIDAVGNTSTATVTVNVVAVVTVFKICLDYDSTKAVPKGTTLLIKIELCDAAGKNLSSAAHTLKATNVDGGAAPPANVTGGTNVGLLFKLDSTKHYNYNLITNGYSVGSHVLNFTVNGVTNVKYVAPFKIK